MASSAAALLRWSVPLLRARTLRAAAWALPGRYSSGLPSEGDLHSPPAAASSSECDSTGSDGFRPLHSQHASLKAALTEAECEEWKNEEKQILKEVEHIKFLTKEILHSNRYKDGECLSAEDEMFVREKLLCHHPCSDEKIGCGLHSILVDRHPEYRYSRCMFVVRTDGTLTDFSYNKCLKEYIRTKYPSHAESLISKQFARR